MVVLSNLENTQIGLVESSFELGVHRECRPLVLTSAGEEIVVRMPRFFAIMASGLLRNMSRSSGFFRLRVAANRSSSRSTLAENPSTRPEQGFHVRFNIQFCIHAATHPHASMSTCCIGFLIRWYRIQSIAIGSQCVVRARCADLCRHKWGDEG